MAGKTILVVGGAALFILQKLNTNHGGNFSFSSEWLAEQHDLAVKETTSDESNKTVGFGGTIYEYQPQRKVQEKIENVMQQAKMEAAINMDRKFEAASKKKKK